MLTAWFAARYFLSRKSHGAVNIISAISVAAIAVAAAAMVIVLSVFNGFSRLAESKLSAIDPNLLIEAPEGAEITDEATLCAKLSAVEGVTLAAPELRMLSYALSPDGQMPVNVRAMTSEAISASGIGNIIIDKTEVPSGEHPAIVSVGVAIGLGLRPGFGDTEFQLVRPREVARINPANPMSAFARADLSAAAVFQAQQQEFDANLVIVNYAYMARQLGDSTRVSAIALYLAPGADAAKTGRHVREICSSRGLKLLDRAAQQPQTFRMIAIEKWITFAMLGFILLLASANIIATLSMLILEKEGNIRILAAIGAPPGFTGKIFVWQGAMIIISGTVAGILLGILLVLLQQWFGIIKFSADPAMLTTSVYPTVLKAGDILVTLCASAIIALLTAKIVPLLQKKQPQSLR